MAATVNIMLEQVTDMTYFKSWTFFTPGEEVSKYCFKVLLEANSFARLMIFLTHCGRVTQICVFTLQLSRTGEADLRF